MNVQQTDDLQTKWTVFQNSIDTEKRVRAKIKRARKISTACKVMSYGESKEREAAYKWARDTVGKELVDQGVEGIWNRINYEETNNA